MARAPVYDGNQVQGQALRPVFQNNIDVSSGVQALARGVGDVGAAAERVVRRDAEIEANEADNAITAGWLQWDSENRRKYQGAKVGEYETEATKWWDKARDAYAGKLSPMAARAIDQQLGRKRNTAMGSVLGYVSAEKERTADTEYDTAQKASAQWAVTTGDTAGMSEAIRKRASEFAARKGLGTDAYDTEVLQRLGTMHMTMVQSLAETDATKAAEYYAQAKKRNEIPATAQPQIEKLLKAEGDNQFAMTFAAEKAGMPLAEQLSEAAKIADPERKKKTIQQVQTNFALTKAAQAEREGAAADEAWQLVGKGRRVPESVLERMDGKARVQLQEHVADRVKMLAERAQPKTDWQTYIDLREKLATGEKVDLRPYAGTKIAPAQLEQLLDIQTRVRDPKKAPEVATSEQQMGAFAAGMNLKGEELGKFKSAAIDLFNEHLKAKGKEPTFDERQTILDGLTKEVVTKPGFLWDSKDKAFLAPRDVRMKAMTADKFTVGQVYTDKTGNRAKYLGGGNWEPIK